MSRGRWLSLTYVTKGFGFLLSRAQPRPRRARHSSSIGPGTQPARTIRDLDSGVGFWAEEFARHFAKVVAVDPVDLAELADPPRIR